MPSTNDEHCSATSSAGNGAAGGENNDNSNKNTNHNSNTNNSNNKNNDDEENEEIIPPHCHITIRCTREIAGFNGFGDVVRRLNFRSSVRDRRRFHYICALLRLLVAHKGIANLSGSAQKQLLQMVEEVATHGI